MALQGLLHEPERCSLVPLLGDEALEHLAFMIDGTPQVAHLAVHLHVHLVEMPPPLSKPAHPAHTLPTDVTCKQRSESVPPVAHRLVADVDAALGQQVF